MTAYWFESLGISLLLTLLFETGATLIAGKRRRAILTVILANFLTNPPVVLAVLLWRNAVLKQEALLTAGLEVSAVIVEALIYRLWREDFPHPWRFSFFLNLFSFGMGLLLRQIF